MLRRSILAVAAFVAACYADGLTITQPSSTVWWLKDSVNTLAWTCDTSSYDSYTVVISNSDTNIQSAPLALIAQLYNYECSHTISKELSHLAVSSTWTLSLANSVNMSDIYASTQFEVKSADAGYPTVTSAAGTATGTAAGASSTSGSKTGGAIANCVSVGMSMAAALVLGLVVV